MYPADANLIISLLDIHPPIDPEVHTRNGPLEIFEAGTGHGALTLYLARAIHGLNPPPPPLPPRKPNQKGTVDTTKPEDPDIIGSDQAATLIGESPTGELASETSDISSPDQGTTLLGKSTEPEPHPNNPDIPALIELHN